MRDLQKRAEAHAMTGAGNIQFNQYWITIERRLREILNHRIDKLIDLMCIRESVLKYLNIVESGAEKTSRRRYESSRPANRLLFCVFKRSFLSS